MKNHENPSGSMKTHEKLTWNHENHENPPGTMKKHEKPTWNHEKP